MKQASTLVIALALLAPCSEAAAVTRARFLMGTVCEISIDGPAAEREADLAFAEAGRVEALLSTWTDASELARVNRGEVEAGPELAALLDVVLKLAGRTAGAFDPRVKDLVDAWRTRDDGAVPSEDAIADALARRHSARPRFEEGAFGKGYALDRMLTTIGSPAAMIDFGGQVLVRGTMPVAVADPARRQHPVVSFTMSDGSISTTSGSEKTFEVAGRRFSHILDPRSGQALPPRGSVSVIADQALTADILSTALYVMGEDDGLRWADANDVAALYITPDRTIRLSAPARERVRDLQVLDRKFKLKD